MNKLLGNKISEIAAVVICVIFIACCIIFPAIRTKKSLNVITEYANTLLDNIGDSDRSRAEAAILNIENELNEVEQHLLLFYPHQPIYDLKECVDTAQKLIPTNDMSLVIAEFCRIVDCAEQILETDSISFSKLI